MLKDIQMACTCTCICICDVDCGCYQREAIVVQHDHVGLLGLAHGAVSKAEAAATGGGCAVQLTP